MCVPTDFDVEIPSCNLPRVKGQAMGLDERNNSEAFVIFFFLSSCYLRIATSSKPTPRSKRNNSNMI